MATKKIKYAKDITLKVDSKFMLVDAPNVQAVKLGETVLIVGKLGQRVKSDFNLKGSKKTVVSHASVEDGKLHVTAWLSIKDVETALRDAKKRLRYFKTHGKTKSDTVFSHFGPDLSILLGE